MKYRAFASLTFALTFAAVVAVLLAVPAAAQGPPGLGSGNTCAEVCSLSEPDTCLLGCQTPGGQNMACWQWFGQLDPDLDDDGVANASDNCVCRANADQANCDGDPYGDVCDVDDTLWELTEERSDICFVQVIPDRINGFPALSGWSSELHTNVCGSGGTCIDVVPAYYYHQCTSWMDPEDCCYFETQLSNTVCTNLNFSLCGGPECDF